MKQFVHANRLVFFLAALVTATHFPDDVHCAEISQATLTSAYSEVSAKACNTEIDKSDPNETPYQVCPGVLDYSLFVRKVDSGRKSIDIVSPSKQVFPLRYDEFITRHMSELAPKIEWRISKETGQSIPTAIIVRVWAHESSEEPEKVTRTYFAIAKITVKQACVTDRIAEKSVSRSELLRRADMARAKNCLPALPHL